MPSAVDDALSLLSAERPPPKEVINALAARLSAAERKLFQSALEARARAETLQRRVLDSARLAEAALGSASFIHELRHHLAPLLGFSELLRDGPHSARAAEWAGEIAHLSLRLAELVRRHGELLHRKDGPEEPVDLAQLAQEASRYFERLPPGVCLQLSVSEGLPPASCRRTGLLHALLNLLSNARDAHAEQPGVISVRACLRGERLELSVADQGCGIAPEARARLFEPLFTTKGESGTGLGLYLSRALVAPGELLLLEASEAPKGAVTCFAIRLRRAAL
ncbi:MAG: HAMP domain-containing histidine kinase [Myxococcales bacterium]|nr:HAMP domain-containing histidine kinase [Myxococcales bacterium]